MCKKLIKHFTIWIKKVVNEKDLENKPLEYLLIAKEDENAYYSSKLPIFFAWLWIVVSVYVTVQVSYNSWQMTNAILFNIFPYVSLLFTIRLWKLFYDLKRNNRITDDNLKVYNKVIMEKIEEKNKEEKKYRKKIISYLKGSGDGIKK